MTDQESAEAVLRAAAESATAAAEVATHTAGRLNAVLAATAAAVEAATAAFPTRGYAAFSDVPALGEAIRAARAAHIRAERSYMSAMRVYLLSGEALLRVVRAVGTVVQAPDTTVADLSALAVVLHTAVREVERQRQAAVSAEPPGLALGSYRWTVVGGLAGIVSVLIALLSLVQDRIEADRPDPPPSVTVIVEPPGPAEINRRVDERLRELEQQHQAGHDTDDPRPPSAGR